MPDYDAFLLLSFGGPEGPADVMPFLENVTRGRGVPRDRLAAVARHYDVFGGVSPINEQCRDLLAAIGKDFAAAGLDLPLYWGNRNWHPFLADTVAQMASDGVRRLLVRRTEAVVRTIATPFYIGYHGTMSSTDGPEHRASTRSAIFSTTQISSGPVTQPPAQRSRHPASRSA